MQRTFPTPGPPSVFVEIGSGRVTVRAEQVDETTVDVSGSGADETLVEQRGNQIVVVGPKGGFLRSREVIAELRVPLGSELTTQLGSADLTVSGRIGTARLKAGSGEIDVEEIAGSATAEAGSGDIEIGLVAGDLKVRSGSGDVALGRLESSASIATGSGNIRIEASAGRVQMKSGSGDTHVGDASADVTATTASGDVTVERFRLGAVQAKAVSGDVRIGVVAGIPVWTDVSTVSGHISSSLDGAGQPADGQPFVELRATTVSGDILLEQR